MKRHGLRLEGRDAAREQHVLTVLGEWHARGDEWVRQTAMLKMRELLPGAYPDQPMPRPVWVSRMESDLMEADFAERLRGSW